MLISRLKRSRLQSHPKAEFAQLYKSDQLLMFHAGELLRSGSDFTELLDKPCLGDPK